MSHGDYNSASGAEGDGAPKATRGAPGAAHHPVAGSIAHGDEYIVADHSIRYTATKDRDNTVSLSALSTELPAGDSKAALRPTGSSYTSSNRGTRYSDKARVPKSSCHKSFDPSAGHTRSRYTKRTGAPGATAPTSWIRTAPRFRCTGTGPTEHGGYLYTRARHTGTSRWASVSLHSLRNDH